MSDIYKNYHVLIEHLKKGMAPAYEYLVRKYHKPLFVYAQTLTNNQDSSKDIVQNVFLKLWEYRERLKPEHSIQAFLYKVCYNEFVDQYKKDLNHTELGKAYLEAISEASDDAHAGILERKIALVSQGITLLPEKCAEIFLLSKKEGLTNIEIAEYLNISLKTVEGHITKAYAILRDQLSGKIKSILFLLFRAKKCNKSL